MNPTARVRTPHTPSSPLRPISPGTRATPSPSPQTAIFPDAQRRAATLGPTTPLSATTPMPSDRQRKTSMTPSMPGSPPPAQKSRARDLLRKHYGLGLAPPAPSGRPSDPMDLDSPAFDAKAYYEQLITTSSLSTLLKRENELLFEIRELDSERQSLVYNHHHELIAASDTIGAMKTRAESLDSDLDALRAAFSEISRLVPEMAVDSDE